MLENYEDVFEVKELCEILKIDRRVAYKLLNSGKIPHRRIGRYYKIPKEVVILYLKKNQEKNDETQNHSRKE